MRKFWAVTIEVEHEYNYVADWDYPEDHTAVAVNTIRVERQVHGDDETCDALHAASTAFIDLKNRYAIPENLHMTKIEIKEVE